MGLWSTRRFVALDFETTGLDVRRDHIISIGAIPIEQGRIRLDKSLSIVVDPGVLPTPASVRVHGLRPVDVTDGVPLSAGAGLLRAMIGADDLVVWTAWVERAFLRKMFGGSTRRWARRLVDTRPLVVGIEEADGLVPSPARTGELADTARRWEIPPEPAHDALADAFVTAQLFAACMTRLGRAPVGLTERRGRPRV
ncbi:MAG: 3'-5' exonuclease [Acidimicrobiia bacterium]|nr:3'-5' exonuclease [Acidimicrobiia bacterium]MDH4308941.1 3'-5' exonuclease [Acidimicrobiia bacterium]MDH5292960.1 3'-5' exonuclease [Acidimicrobiia bacterium]